jgi:hypothetical protein
VNRFVFKNDDLVKQSRPGYKEPVISYNAYPPDRRLCIYTVLKEYLFRTKKMRDSSISRLLLSYVKSSIGTVLDFALEVEADLTLCEPNILVFIPERFKIIFIYLEIVSLVTFL